MLHSMLKRQRISLSESTRGGRHCPHGVSDEMARHGGIDGVDKLIDNAESRLPF